MLGDDFLLAKIFLQTVDTTEEKDKNAIRGIVAILTYEDKFDQCFGELLEQELRENGKHSSRS